MAIRYKVVNKERKSCFVGDGYQLTYHKGETIHTKKGTIGIFVFKRRKDAWEFICNPLNDFNDSNTLILRVKTLTSGSSLRIRPTCYNKNLIYTLGIIKKLFIKNQGSNNSISDLILSKGLYRDDFKELNDGTMVYDKVYVVD